MASRVRVVSASHLSTLKADLRLSGFHSILTPLFKTFAKSSIPIHSKLSVLAYLTSYWAIAVAALTW